jgi:hypothetical protein
MKGMCDEDPRSTRGAVKEHVIEDRLANMSIEGGEGILDGDDSPSV